jgi:hypothetical protein
VEPARSAAGASPVGPAESNTAVHAAGIDPSGAMPDSISRPDEYRTVGAGRNLGTHRPGTDRRERGALRHNGPVLFVRRRRVLQAGRRGGAEWEADDDPMVVVEANRPPLAASATAEKLDDASAGSESSVTVETAPSRSGPRRSSTGERR